MLSKGRRRGPWSYRPTMLPEGTALHAFMGSYHGLEGP